jgi:GAF domain-containing protein
MVDTAVLERHPREVTQTPSPLGDVRPLPGPAKASAEAAYFAEIAAELASSRERGDTVEKILTLALQAVGGRHARVLLVHSGRRFESLASTDLAVAELDELQMQLGEGPDLDLVRSRYSVLVADTAVEPRWPRWSSAAAEQGLRSMVGAPLYRTDHVLGSLDLYDAHPDRFCEVDRQVITVLARHAAIALQGAMDSANLVRALDSRKVIGMAEGILIERLGLDDQQAFNVLRRYSQDRNMKLRDVAQVVVDTHRLPT